ncbi:hypothetical protein ILUMI_14496 [Ignelater luminosus]|uniref:Uncharacterized protein n=1 Tax=Ignelater luminosus TaxID=2038154 RepID=A0A8K0CUN9_IGNLU|nr:hypothetical protein ILUMI_14496 [Ignelater luminosus]
MFTLHLIRMIILALIMLSSIENSISLVNKIKKPAQSSIDDNNNAEELEQINFDGLAPLIDQNETTPDEDKAAFERDRLNAEFVQNTSNFKDYDNEYNVHFLISGMVIIKNTK